MTKPLWLAEDVVRATRGRCLHEQDWAAYGVSIDSRTVHKGDLFIALQGPAHDGHDHVAAAIAAGAVAAIVAHQPLQTPPDAPLIFVEDTLQALQDLGRAGRNRAKGKIVAVTGSVGKTSSKEMLRIALGAVGTVYANPGSFNNHWGLPLALASLPQDTNFGIFEMGMNHAGELTALSQIARPDIALITTVEAAHLEFFASVEAIADAKAEIFQGMNENGVAILNKDNPHFARLAAAAKAKGIKKILSFARETKTDCYTTHVTLAQDNSFVSAIIAGRDISYKIGAPGAHLMMNSLGVLLTAFAASGKIDPCATALIDYRPPQGRGLSEKVALPDSKSFTLIDESYNASPASIRAMIGVLEKIQPAGNGRRILVLGDMRELGTSSPDLHAALAVDIIAAKIDRVFCCGDMMQFLFNALPSSVREYHAPDSQALAPLVASTIRADDVIAIKGSKSMKMERVIAALKALSPSPQHKIAS